MKIKNEELRAKSVSELKEELSKTLREQFKLRLIKGTGELTHTHMLRAAKRLVARIQTILAEKLKTEGN